MKIIIFCTTIFFIACCINARSQDPVKNAYKENEEKAEHDLVDKNVAEFLVKATEGRLLCINEAKLGVLKGSTSDVRNYAQSMVKDQTSMLDELKKIAAERNITLPDGVSDKNREGQMDLSEEAGKDFDEKFIKLIRLALERDIKALENANELDDPEIKLFAEKYRPLIQSYLESIQRIEDEDL